MDGIKSGLEEAHSYVERVPDFNNIILTDMNDSTEANQLGAVANAIGIDRLDTQKFPSADLGGYVVSNENIPDNIKKWPIPEGRAIAVIEKASGDSKVFAANFLARVRRTNKVRTFRLGDENIASELAEFSPDLLLLPEGDPFISLSSRVEI